MEPKPMTMWRGRDGVHSNRMEDTDEAVAVTPRADFDAREARLARAEQERDEARDALAEERASRYPCNGPGELWRPLAMDDGPPRLYIFQRKRIDESDTPPSYMEISEEDGTLLLHYVKHGEADDSIIVECGADLPLRKMAEAARGDLAAATARADKAERELALAMMAGKQMETFRDEQRGRAEKAEAQRDAMNAQYEAAMEVIHRNAGARRDGLCGILAWIDRAKEAEALLREARRWLAALLKVGADKPAVDALLARIDALLEGKANG